MNNATDSAQENMPGGSSGTAGGSSGTAPEVPLSVTPLPPQVIQQLTTMQALLLIGEQPSVKQWDTAAQWLSQADLEELTRSSITPGEAHSRTTMSFLDAAGVPETRTTGAVPAALTAALRSLLNAGSLELSAPVLKAASMSAGHWNDRQSWHPAGDWAEVFGQLRPQHRRFTRKETHAAHEVLSEVLKAALSWTHGTFLSGSADALLADLRRLALRQRSHMNASDFSALLNMVLRAVNRSGRQELPLIFYPAAVPLLGRGLPEDDDQSVMLLMSSSDLAGQIAAQIPRLAPAELTRPQATRWSEQRHDLLHWTARPSQGAPLPGRAARLLHLAYRNRWRAGAEVTREALISSENEQFGSSDQQVSSDRQQRRAGAHPLYLGWVIEDLHLLLRRTGEILPEGNWLLRAVSASPSLDLALLLGHFPDLTMHLTEYRPAAMSALALLNPALLEPLKRRTDLTRESLLRRHLGWR